MFARTELDGPLTGSLLLTLAAGLAMDDRDVILRCRQAMLDVLPEEGALGGSVILLGGANAGAVARAHEALGDVDLAESSYRTAITVDARLGATVPLVRGQLGLCRCLLALRRPGDRAEILLQLSRAESRLPEVELEPLHAEAAALRREVAARFGTVAAGPLSAREREVAEHVAEGRSNREIAQALVLSERTVESHVRNALVKLQLRRREELVAWMIRSQFP
jgi:DNA-binding CsgD family transcriptional regulator